MSNRVEVVVRQPRSRSSLTYLKGSTGQRTLRRSGLVAGNDREATPGRDHGDQIVTGRDGAKPGGKAAPLGGGAGVDRKNAVFEPSRQLRLQPLGDPGVATAIQIFDALADFAERRDADERGFELCRAEPVEDQARRFRSRQFREHAGINKKARRSMSCGGDRSRLIPKSTMARSGVCSSSAGDGFGRFGRS